MDDRPAWEDSGGAYRKMVMVNVYGKLEDLGVLPDLDDIGPATGIALPVPHG